MDAARRLGAFVFALMLVCAAQARLLDEHAKMLLLRSMEHAYNVNVRAIVVQRCEEDDCFQQLKIEQSRNGCSRYTVLRPLRYQGIESVDDGTKAVTYLPDSKVVLVQDSSRRESCRAQERLRMAEKNYRLTVEASPEIAGRKTVCVVAAPKSDTLEKRLFYLDAETAYLLRFETVSTTGATLLKFDTKTVSYPAEIIQPAMLLQPAGTSTVKCDRQVALSSNPSSQVGFDPLLPKRLPYGFKVQESRVTKSESWKAVVVRVTDGLVRATVYEWKPESGSREGEELAPDRSVLDTRGIRLLLVSDMPKPAREGILRAFAATNAQATLWDPSGTKELNGGHSLFNRVSGFNPLPKMPCASTD